MKINVKVGNNEDTVTISGEKTIKDLLESMEIAAETVVVKKNDYIVIDEEILEDGDSIEVIQVIYGG
ncbi:thiamineS protein [Methanobacterium lacus]|jgi:sulfur carrier protein|uniref:ThiamineS protein n=1 Tax=Methanobacterium lacus (strain AL-21) TaxID=877455 RepID=F0T9J7_METLA|nr:MoaD/ThiS family protein [Methanobacterium lacus]ADZ08745.1 thiamineS protein [Methanobacterium lacus]